MSNPHVPYQIDDEVLQKLLDAAFAGERITILASIVTVGKRPIGKLTRPIVESMLPLQTNTAIMVRAKNHGFKGDQMTPQRVLKKFSELSSAIDD